ncbi:MAG: O-antigen ligase family protein [Candidatus Cloacimonetes bacterium]|nr:O-antigen ligase family protein [Candidatus Cloacimonadota bacterium]
MKQIKTLLLAWFFLYALVEFFPVYRWIDLGMFVVCAVICLLWLLVNPNHIIITRQLLLPISFLTFWLGYSLLSYIWAHDRMLAVSYSFWILRYLLIFLMFSQIFRVQRIRERFHLFLLLIMILYLGIAIYEMITWNHLPGSRYHGMMVPIPTGPFIGENILAAYWLVLSPFLLFIPKLLNRSWLIPVVMISIFLIIGIMVFQGARIAVISMLALVGYYFVWHLRWKMKLAVLALMILVGYGLTLRYEQYSRILHTEIKHQMDSIGEERQSIRMSSIKIRSQLIDETIEMLSGSGGLGVGGGNYETVMLKEAKYRTGGITNPHSYLMELLGNFGVLVCLGFLALYFYWVSRLFLCFRRSDGKTRYLYLSYLLSLLLFIPASSIPFSIRWDYFVWIYFAGINAIAHADVDPKPGTDNTLSDQIK